MLTGLKLQYVALNNFTKQVAVRGWVDSLRLLWYETCLLWLPDKNAYYIKRHELNIALLKRVIRLKNSKPAEPVSDYKIWVLWWQGEDQMPPIVKCTYKSICRMAGREVVLVTKDNWQQYIIPDEWIVCKVAEGKMKLPALSDYIRASLLYEYGGMWIDSTVLCTRKLPEEIFDREFFTIHNPNSSTKKYVAQGRWNVQILGTNQRYLPVFGGLRHVFQEYWKRYDTIMDYLPVDYSIDYVYNENSTMRKLIDEVPVTNTRMHILLDWLDLPYSKVKAMWQEVQQDTWFFKLTYKHKFIEQINGEKTFYKYLMDEWK